jgi:hypothetical protein
MSSQGGFGGYTVAQTQLAPIVPGVRQDFALSLADFNHVLHLPVSSLLRYANDARFHAFATWPALARMMQEDIGSDILVKAHLIRVLKPNGCRPASILGVAQVSSLN